MRQIILDTETTGMDPQQGDRLVEIGCVEVMNYVPTGRTYHVYINPERDVPAEAVAVHGLTTQFLKDKPYFSQIYTDFLDFVAEGHLVIHNAEFDMKFINAELRKVGHRPIPDKRVTDTLIMARRKFPGSPASLDALCRRFGIDNSAREYHGALLDAQLLAEVYLEMMGGRQHGLGLSAEAQLSHNEQGALVSQHAGRAREYRAPRPHAASAEELAAHASLRAQLKDPLWND
ncbi:MAG TPA: DNA polymerase III subunit epsilon [Micavibrio sp.]